MTITIKKFYCNSNGKMTKDGRMDLSGLLTNQTIDAGLLRKRAVPGTPSTISNSSSLYGKSHLGTSLIKLTQDYETGECLHIIDGRIRILYYSGECKFKNLLLYAFTNMSDVDITTLTYTVAFANCLIQTSGDYIDIQIPDGMNYLVLLLCSNGFPSASLNEDGSYSLPSNIDYFCIDPSRSASNIDQSHSINIKGYSSIHHRNQHLLLAFEDKTFVKCDRDYNDVLIVLGCPSIMDLGLSMNDDTVT